MIGYGNELRGDDGAGVWAAQAVEGWELPGVRALAARQLTPELAEAVAESEVAVFVDATTHTAASGDESYVILRPVVPSDSLPSMGHTGTPADLLGLAMALYGRCPRAWWLLVPGVEFGIGTEMSAFSRRSMAQALRLIRALLQ